VVLSGFAQLLLCLPVAAVAVAAVAVAAVYLL